MLDHAKNNQKEVKIVNWILLLILALCLCGCESKVMIRIANRTDMEMQNVVVDFAGQRQEYGNIPPGGVTSFRQVKKAYRCAYIHAMVDGKEAILEPKDCVGEEPLETGRYTYALTFDPTVKDKYVRLRLECEKE